MKKSLFVRPKGKNSLFPHFVHIMDEEKKNGLHNLLKKKWFLLHM